MENSRLIHHHTLPFSCEMSLGDRLTWEIVPRVLRSSYLKLSSQLARKIICTYNLLTPTFPAGDNLYSPYKNIKIHGTQHSGFFYLLVYISVGEWIVR